MADVVTIAEKRQVFFTLGFFDLSVCHVARGDSELVLGCIAYQLSKDILVDQLLHDAFPSVDLSLWLSIPLILLRVVARTI